jgi:protein-tyrosine phosphatase
MLKFERYGGRGGYLAHLSALARVLVGQSRALQQIEWHKIERLVFVCAGNICRSPYGAERARMSGVPAVSFGLTASSGATADPVAQRNALRRDVDLTQHRSTRLEANSVEAGDLVVLFEQYQVDAFYRLNKAQVGGVSLAGLWSRPLRPHVADPYGKSDGYFQECFSIIDSSVAELCGRMQPRRVAAAAAGAR